MIRNNILNNHIHCCIVFVINKHFLIPLTPGVLPDKSNHEESRLLREHKEEVEELHRDLNERDEKIDSLIEDHQVQLQVK